MKPILFRAPMIKAILEGRKTQTRRVVKLADDNPAIEENRDRWELPVYEDDRAAGYVMDFSKTFPLWQYLLCPYGKLGNLLWVRETWQAQNQNGQWWHEIKGYDRALYNWAWTNPVLPALKDTPPRWLPAIHMPQNACRITLPLKGIRVERVQEITEADAIAEGIEDLGQGVGRLDHKYGMTRGLFAGLWNDINLKRGYGWETNPLVWVLEFERVNNA